MIHANPHKSLCAEYPFAPKTPFSSGDVPSPLQDMETCSSEVWEADNLQPAKLPDRLGVGRRRASFSD